MIGKKSSDTTQTTSAASSAPGDVKAILGKGSEFEGKLRFEGTVRIDGKFKGEVHSAGTLIVGDHAVIDGDLDVDSAIISGEIKGNVIAKKKVELTSPAKLFGNVTTPSLAIQEGVVFNGECKMTKDGSAPKPAASPSSGDQGNQ